jgi:methionyl-tRNA formyltransferase
MLGGKKLTAHQLMPHEPSALVGGPADAGAIRVERDRLFVRCGGGTWLELVEVQMEGKKRMSAGDFLHGHLLKSGNRLGEQ